MRKPLRKKKIVTPRALGAMEMPACPMKTTPTARALIPSSDGITKPEPVVFSCGAALYSSTMALVNRPHPLIINNTDRALA
jgi:hypothetical protein